MSRLVCLLSLVLVGCPSLPDADTADEESSDVTAHYHVGDDGDADDTGHADADADADAES